MWHTHTHTHTHTHIYNGVLAIKENEIMPFAMDGPRDYQTKWNKSEKDKYHMISYMWNIKYNTKWMYLQNRNRLIDIDRHREQADLPRGWGWERNGLESGISRYKLLCIGWINKVPVCSTGKFIQYPVINHNGKEYEKEYTRTHTHTHIYIKLDHCAIQQKLTQRCKSTILQ